MRTTLRAALALGLLAGVYVLGIAVVTALVTLAYFGFTFGHFGGAKVGILCLIGAFGVLRGLLSVVRHKREPLPGVAVSPAEQPLLWQTVRELAEHVGTRPPDRIHLVEDVNAAVTEDARFLGLRPGPRTMLIGVPLLLTLSVAQLRAVLCHELGHYSGRHTQLGPLTYRGFEALRRVLVQLQDRPVLRRVFELYARLFFLASRAVSRRQELEADAAAARVAGRRAMASALREVDVTAAAWGFFMQNYVSFGAQGGHLPADLIGGFHRLLQEPSRQGELAELRAEPPADDTSRYDSHPSLAARLAALDGVDDADVADDPRPAAVLLADADTAFGRVQDAMYDGWGLPAAGWDEVVDAGARAGNAETGQYVVRAAEHLSKRPPTLEAILSLLEQGCSQQLGMQFAGPENARDAVVTSVTGLLAATLREAGKVRWRLSWAGPCELVDDAGRPVDLEARVADAVDVPDRVPALREWLEQQGVPLSGAPAPAPDSSSGDWGAVELYAVLQNVVSRRRPFDVLVTDRGLLVVPVRRSVAWAFALVFGSGSQARKRIRKLLEQRFEDLTAAPGNELLPVRAIEAAEFRRRLTSWVLTLSLKNGTRRTLKCEHTSADDALNALGACLYDRLQVVDRKGEVARS